MDRLARFAAARNFALYYGAGRDGELARFDVAVVEPAGQNEASLRRMQDSGTLVLAYLSVVEIPPWAPEIKLLKCDDFLCSRGEPLINECGNRLADLRSSRWTGLLLYRAGSLLARSGYDGLFLDTIGDVESVGFAAETRDSLLLAAAGAVRRIRTVFPGHVLVQNNGLERLCLMTAEYLNGICWENPMFGNKPFRPWTEAMVARLESLKNKYGLKVLLLLEAGNKPEPGTGPAAEEIDYSLAQEIAGKKGFLLYRSPHGYVGGVNPPEGME